MMAVFNISTQTLIWGVWILNCYIVRRSHYRGMVNSSICVVDFTGEIVNFIDKQIQKQVKVYCKHKSFFFFLSVSNNFNIKTKKVIILKDMKLHQWQNLSNCICLLVNLENYHFVYTILSTKFYKILFK